MRLQCLCCDEQLYDHAAYRHHIREMHGVIRFVKEFRFENDNEFEEARELWRSTKCVQFVKHGSPWICNEYSAQMFYCSRCAMTKTMPKAVDDSKRMPVLSNKSDKICTAFMQVSVYSFYY